MDSRASPYERNERVRKSYFDVDTWLDLREPTIRVPMHVSPDGALLAVSSQGRKREATAGAGNTGNYTKNGVPVEAVGSRVYLVHTDSGQVIVPFGEQATSWGAQWSPDGRLLAAYASMTGGDAPVLALWKRDDGGVLLFDRVPVRPFFGFEVPRWTPDSLAVVVKLVPSGPASEQGPVGRQSGAGAGSTPRVRVHSFDPGRQALEASEPAGWSDTYRCDLAVVEVETGAVRRLIEGLSTCGWKVAPDGRALALLRDAGASQRLAQSYFDLVIVSLEGGDPATVAHGIPQSYGVCFNWSPDSKRIAYTTTERAGPTSLFVVPADGSRPPLDLGKPEGDLGLSSDYEAPRWTEDGEHILCLSREGYREFSPDGSYRRKVNPELDRAIIGWAQPPTAPNVWLPLGSRDILVVTRDDRNKNTGLARINAQSGEAIMLTEFPKRWHGYTYALEAGLAAPDGRSTVYMLLESSDHPVGVWKLVLDAASPDPQLLFPFNRALESIALGTSRLIEYRTLDGEKRRATLMLPPEYEEGQQVPVVVEVYAGGIGSEAVHVFGGSDALLNWQVLAGRGCAVLYPDMPLKPGGPLGQLPGLVLPAIDALIELGIADPARIGLMGHSFGGYTVLALLTQSTRFRAAVAASGLANLTSFYGVLTDGGDSAWIGWLENGLPGMGGSLWEKPLAYVENSPLFYMDQVETPLLLICGTKWPDEPAQWGEAFSALRRLNKRVEARFYEGEDHGLGMWSEGSFRDVCSRILIWFDEHLSKDT